MGSPAAIQAGLWRRDPQGIHWGGADLFLTPRDMARFGYLYLKHGVWNGRQIVPREWVAESTRAQVKTGGWGGVDDYGYWWWIDPAAHVAIGLGGQVIAVVPEQDLVVVFTGAVPESVPFALIRRYVVPAVRLARLPPQPAAERALSALERALERPPPREPAPVPAAANGIARAPFLLGPNPFGFTALRLRCAGPTDCAIELTSPRATTVLAVGLDGGYRVTAPASAEDVPVACAGAWIGADSPPPAFLLSVVQLGEPAHLDVRFAFDGDRAAITVVRKSFDVRTSRFEGVQARP